MRLPPNCQLEMLPTLTAHTNNSTAVPRRIELPSFIAARASHTEVAATRTDALRRAHRVSGSSDAPSSSLAVVVEADVS